MAKHISTPPSPRLETFDHHRLFEKDSLIIPAGGRLKTWLIFLFNCSDTGHIAAPPSKKPFNWIRGAISLRSLAEHPVLTADLVHVSSEVVRVFTGALAI